MRPLILLFGIVLTAVAGLQTVCAVEPVPDERFPQEYRDPFVLGATAEENDVRAISVAADGRVWTATAAGIRLVEAGKLTEPAGDRIDGPAYDIAAADKGVVWVGAWNGVYKIEQGSVRRVPGLEGPVTSVALPRGQLLAGNPQGLHAYNGRDWKLVPGNWATSVRDIAFNDDWLYVASWSGLFRRQGDRSEFLAPPGRLRSRNVHALAVSREGDVWVGSRGGLDVLHNGKPTTSYTGREGLPSSDVRALAFDSDGRLWAGTALGVARFDGKGWSLRHSLRWLPDNDVRDIAFAPNGAAWIATRAGVSVLRTKMMTLDEKAAHFQRMVRARHVRPPGLVERCFLPTPGDLTNSKPMDTDNDGMYTGLYLAAEAYRYAVTGAADAKANATEAYRAMEFLQTVTGTPGFVARTVVPSDWSRMADRNRSYTPQQVAEEHAGDVRWKKVEERWRRSADGKWLWKGDTSSDEITGHYFAYAIYYDLVADATEKKRVAALVRRITDHIIDGGYELRDIDGEPTRWGVWSPAKLNDDPNWWMERGCNSVEILSYLTVARHVTGDGKYERELETLLTKHNYAENILTPMFAQPDYFTYIGFQLLAMSYPALLQWEEDPARRSLYLKSLERWFAPMRDDNSPLFAFVYGMGGRGDFRARECVELLRDVPLDMVQWNVDNSLREDVQIVGRPDAEERQTDRLLPPSERAVFRWDRNVYLANNGSQGRVEGSSAFWLAPYWMGRYYGFIGGPEE